MPTKKDARLCAKTSFQLFRRTNALILPDRVKMVLCTLVKSFIRGALAFEIRLKGAHRVYARNTFSHPSALGRAESSELSPQCSIKVQCTLIECILWPCRQEHWHSKNPQLWEQVHGLLLYWMGVIVSWSLSVCPGYILVHFLRAVHLSFATWLLQMIFPGSQYSLQRLQVQRKHLVLTAAHSLCGLWQVCWPLL